jgi:hypothetical protein
MFFLLMGVVVLSRYRRPNSTESLLTQKLRISHGQAVHRMFITDEIKRKRSLINGMRDDKGRAP